MTDRTIINDILSCPVCGGKLLLTEDGKSAACDGRGKRHLFDFSSGGYINLYTSRAAGGDNAECINARNSFLSKGYYAPISDAINALLIKYAGTGQVLDAGCGEGYYTGRMAEAGFTAFGFDLSKSGVNIAAKAAKRASLSAFYGVASVFDLPVLSGTMDAVTTIFAPCAEEEYARVLKDGGVLILAGAGKDHLIGLKQAIYDSAYDNEGRRDLPRDSFELLEETSVSYDVTLKSAEDIASLFAMTPYFYRTSQKDKEKLHTICELSTKIDVELFIYKKK